MALARLLALAAAVHGAAGNTNDTDPTPAPTPAPTPVPVLTFPKSNAQGTVAFHTFGGKCGSGADAYYGYLGGEAGYEDKFIIEIMGGAVCFNHTSCNDDWLGSYMDIQKYLKDKLGVDDGTWNVLSSGSALPIVGNPVLDNKAYFPVIKGSANHPFNKAPGIFFPTCTADIMMGQHSLTYPGANENISDMSADHHGGLNLNIVLQAVKRDYPNLKEILLMGGSGGGVSASVWMGRVAEMFPNAKVKVLVDSGFHMFPGSDFFSFFYDNVLWSNGPGGENDGKIAMPAGEPLPSMAWKDISAIVKDLTTHANAEIAYIACNQDSIVDSDRIKMSQYSAFDGSSIQQRDEMWQFLTHLEKCAPTGRAFSYVGQCTSHHMTKGEIGTDADITGAIALKTFVDNFLSGTTPDSSDQCRTSFWFEEHSTTGASAEGGTCPGTTRTQAQTCPSTPAPTSSPDASGASGLSVVGLLLFSFSTVLATRM